MVATSGNLSDEPICTDEREALERLHDIADLLLVHDRPILRHVDDSIVRLMAGREMVMRRARGFAPLPVMLDEEMPTLLGVGAHQKNTVALSVGRQVFLSQHIGDLETVPASQAFERVVESLEGLYDAKPEAVACDLHPNYISTGYANRICREPVRVQHHYAHVLACMAENGVKAPALGVAWDGSGWGPDGTVWGGEFLKIDEYGYTRVARLRPLRLAGSERAVREPRRCGLGLLYEALYETMGEEIFAREELHPVAAFAAAERKIIAAMLRQGLNSPWTSSAGRLFDAVASLIGVRQISRYEGQAAMELEWLAERSTESGSYEFAVSQPADKEAPAELDWAPMVRAMLAEIARQREAGDDGAQVPQHAGGDDCPRGRRRFGSAGFAHRRMLPEPAADRVDGGAAADVRSQGILAPEGSSQRRRHQPGAGGGGGKEIEIRKDCEGAAMCLAVPGKIVSVSGEDLARQARVDFGGVLKEVNLAYVPEAQIGEYVLVHVGFAISVVDEEEAGKVFGYLKEMGELGELGDLTPDPGTQTQE